MGTHDKDVSATSFSVEWLNFRYVSYQASVALRLSIDMVALLFH